MELSAVPMEIPADANIIIGQAHFIKTVEDLYEVIVGNVPTARFGIAFSEASGDCLIRSEGNNTELKKAAVKNAKAIAAGHIFVILLWDAYPINVLNGVKACQEVCSIFCATANPVEVLVCETGAGRGVVGVVDGLPPKGVEKKKDVKWRKDLLRKIGYKL